MKESTSNKLILSILVIAIVSLFLQFGSDQTFPVMVVVNILDFAILILFGLEIFLRYADASSKRQFIRKNIVDICFFVLFVILFVYSKYITFTHTAYELKYMPMKYVFLRNAFFIIKIVSRFNKLNAVIKSFSKNPAQTTLISFLMVILVGAILLMLPHASATPKPVGFINALFTSTSAVCVTGLVVVDTAKQFSLFGQFVIMLLIQCGGLGIMILTSFTAFLIGSRVSLEDRLTISYMLNENDMSQISKALYRIIFLTFLIEAVGALILFFSFSEHFGFGWKPVFYGVFHAVSAFCNAGFSVFAGNLEDFKSNTVINFTICGLIILGGLSFIVITNLAQNLMTRFKNFIHAKKVRVQRLTLNTRIVVIVTVVLIVGGMLVIYALEHQSQLLNLDIKTQYLAAFFQSVTLRTAGFNTIDMTVLRTPTYLVMTLLMFIGGASGSTAGGIKVNVFGIIYGYIKSIIKGSSDVVVFKNTIARRQVSRALLIVFLAISAVFVAVFMMSLVEDADLVKIVFEVTSAFGTVGLTAGITPTLTVFGKLILIGMMYLGRLGPLTVIAALAVYKKDVVRYPESYVDIS